MRQMLFKPEEHPSFHPIPSLLYLAFILKTDCQDPVNYTAFFCQHPPQKTPMYGTPSPYTPGMTQTTFHSYVGGFKPDHLNKNGKFLLTNSYLSV